MRCFISIELPESVKSGLSMLQRDFQKCGADIRWVKPQGIHLTLKFLGSVEDDKVEGILKIVGGACDKYGFFKLRVSGAGVFPNVRSPRVLWAGVESSEQLSGLQRDVEIGMSSLGFEPEKRDFKPHLTLGRFKSSRGRGRLTDILERYKNIEIGSMEVKALSFMRSDLGPGGAKYTRIAEIPLGKTDKISDFKSQISD